MRVAIIAFVCLWMGLVALSWLMLLRFLILVGVAAALEWRDGWRQRAERRSEAHEGESRHAWLARLPYGTFRGGMRDVVLPAARTARGSRQRHAWRPKPVGR